MAFRGLLLVTPMIIVPHAVLSSHHVAAYPLSFAPKRNPLSWLYLLPILQKKKLEVLVVE